MVTTRCHGRFLGGRPACGCGDCQTRARLRGAYISALEHAARLHTRQAPVEAIAAADLARQAAGERWAAWEASGTQPEATEPEGMAS